MGILKGVAIGFAGSALLMLYMYGFVGFSRLVFVIDAVLLVFLVVGSRLLITTLDLYLRTRRGGGRRVLIYGGSGGRLLVHALIEDRTFLLLPIGFIDDDPAKRRLHVDGVPVLGTIDDLPHLLADREVAELVVTIKSLDLDAWPKWPPHAANVASPSDRCGLRSRTSDRYPRSVMFRVGEPTVSAMVNRAADAPSIRRTLLGLRTYRHLLRNLVPKDLKLNTADRSSAFPGRCSIRW